MVSPHARTGKTPKETREAILDAAHDLLSDRGYRHMTIDEVARHAGLGKGTIYLYFDSKDDLALSIIDRVNARMRERLRSVLRSRAPVVERLRDMLIERVMYRFDSVQQSKECIDLLLAHLRTRLLERRNTYHEQEAVLFVEALVEGRTLGFFEFEDPQMVAHALLTATSALLPYSLTPKELGERDSVQQRCMDVADLLIKGLTAKSVQS